MRVRLYATAAVAAVWASLSDQAEAVSLVPMPEQVRADV